MKKGKRDSGIEQIGKIPWGTHFCQFYKNTEELTEILITYFKTGLENKEYCLWITGKTLTAKQAAEILRKALPVFSEYIHKGQIEFSDYDSLVSQNGTVNPQMVIGELVAKYHRAITRGYAGMRLSTNPCVADDESWDCCNIFEKELHKTAEKYKIIANCTYFLDNYSPAELINVDNRHSFSLLKRQDEWEMTQNVGQLQAMRRIQKINSVLLAIRNVNQSIARIKDKNELLKNVCGVLAEVSHYHYVWLVLTDKSGNITDYFDCDTEAKQQAARICRDNQPACIKQALNQPEITIIKDSADCAECPLKEKIDGHVALLIRLEISKRVIGILTVVMEGKDAEEEEYQLIKEVAGDIAIGLEDIEIENEKTRLTDDLRKSNSFIQTVMDNLPIGIAVNNSTPPVIFEYMNDNFPKIYRTTRKKLKTPDAFWDAVYEEPQMREDMKKRVLEDTSSGDPKRMKWDDLPLYKNGEIVAFVNAMNVPIPDRPLMISLVWDVTGTRQRDIQYNSIIQAAQDAFLYIDMQSNILDVNEAACNMLGYNREELLKMKISQISPAESDGIVLARIQKIKSLGKDFFEIRHKHKNGTLIDVEMSISYFNFQGGRIVAFARDITERKKAEERIRHAYQIINESRIVAFIWKNEENWPISFVSENVKRLWGYKVEDFLSGKIPYSSIVYPDDLGGVFDEVKTASNDKSVNSFEHKPYRIITSEGKIIWVSDKTEIIRDKNGSIIQYQGVIEDISEKKLADEAIHSYIIKLDHITGNFGSGILMENEEHKIEFANEDLFKLLSADFSAVDVMGKDIKDASALGKILFKNSEEFIRRADKIVAEGKKITGEVLATTDDRYIERDYIPIIDEGKIKYHLWIYRDITAAKKLQEQVIVQDRLASIEELASGLAHEINNPLTGIIGFSELLLAKEWSEDVREDLLTINRQAQRTAKIVKSLLTFAKKQPQEKQPVDVNKDLQEILDIRTYKREADNIEIIKHFTTDLPMVKGNSSQLKQVYLNLINNAEFFMYKAHGKGTLTITTEHSKGFVRIIFSDDGAGIDKKNLNRIFEPFFTTKDVGEGTGLGLSICKGIIDEHGGSISVESQPGKGATFTVELPVYKKEG